MKISNLEEILQEFMLKTEDLIQTNHRLKEPRISTPKGSNNNAIYKCRQILYDIILDK